MVKHFCACVVVALLSGCASYSSSFQKIETLLVQEKPQEALAELEKNPRSNTDKLLYLLDKAMLQRMSGLYAESNQSFESAKKLIEQLQGVSIVEQAGALSINDSTTSYEGDDFEQISIHVYEALNYMALGLLDEARVEALQVDLRAKKMAADDKDAIQDAFSQYLTGLIYEFGHEPDNAMIAYRKAYEIYSKTNKRLHTDVPLFLKQDLLRLSKALGLKDEYDDLSKTFNLSDDSLGKSTKDDVEVVLLLNDSLAPIKRSVSLFVLSNTGVPIRISLPVYQSRPSYLEYAILQVGDQSMRAELMNDFDAIAKDSLERHKPAMTARLLARAVLKKSLSNAVSSRNDNGTGDLAGFLVDAVAMATETADTRSWLTLPKKVYMSRVFVKPGQYPASITLFGNKGATVAKYDLGEIEVKKGKPILLEKTFIAPASQMVVN